MELYDYLFRNLYFTTRFFYTVLKLLQAALNYTQL
jgi:hypothetical protein